MFPFGCRAPETDQIKAHFPVLGNSLGLEVLQRGRADSLNLLRLQGLIRSSNPGSLDFDEDQDLTVQSDDVDLTFATPEISVQNLPT